MNHPCHNSSCPEYNHGECFGSGCSLNPMPAPSEPFAEGGDEEVDN